MGLQGLKGWVGEQGQRGRAGLPGEKVSRLHILDGHHIIQNEMSCASNIYLSTILCVALSVLHVTYMFLSGR